MVYTSRVGFYIGTNNCESFHSKSNNIFYKTYPNVNQFIEVIKDVQKDMFIKFQSKTKRRTNILNK